MTIELREVKSMPVLMRWRAEVLRAVFGAEPSQRLLVMNRRYYAAHIDDGSHLTVVARCDGEDAGCGGVCFGDELPSPDNFTGRCAYIMNVYVRPGYRGRGVGRAIVRHLVDEARRRDCGKIYLETTRQADSLYRSVGFGDMSGMMKLYENTETAR